MTGRKKRSQSAESEISPVDLEDLMTPEEAAAYLRVKVQTLAEWRSGRGQATIPYIRLGRRIRYKRSEIKKYIEDNTHLYTIEY